MKKILLSLLFLIAPCAFAQVTIVDSSVRKAPDVIDSLLFTVEYEAQVRTDTSKPDQLNKETMRLLVGKNISEYYSYTAFVFDSVLFVDFSTGASQETINEHARQYGGGVISHKIFKNYPKGKLTLLDKIMTDNYKVEEPMPKLEWEITSDTLTVCDYLCTRATTRFLGRDYEAWFTSEIPRSDGPWKLNGLPGLILKANDLKHDYSFTAVGIEHAKPGQLITFPNEECRPIKRKDLNELFRRMKEDPVGFAATTSPNVVIKFTKDGEEIKNFSYPYNPIELE